MLPVACLLATLGLLQAAVGEPVPAAEGPFARIVVIQPKPGQHQAFEDGYRRHLGWHRDKGDPWTWLGWSFVMGERLGLFMDGTFGHAAENFDHPVDPAGDAADNAVNVIPAADFLSHALYERVDSISSSTALPDTTPFMAMTTYRIQPGMGPFFEEAVARVRRPGREEPQYAWYRLVLGGSPPEYLLFRPAPTMAAAADLGDFFTVEGPDGMRPGDAPGPAGLILEARSELLRYRQDMSYLP